MFSFAYPKLLLLLLLVPAFVALYAWARYARRKNLRKFGNIKVLGPLMPEVSPYKPPIKITLQMIALGLMIIALARPWGGVKDEKTVKEGIEVVIAVDASNSMLASSTGEENGIDRMRTAKLVLEKLINRLDNDRVGLIVYAGDAYTLIPVTSDYVSAKMFLNSIDPYQIDNQGTNIAAAIDMATKSFSEDKKIGKAIILITDAEDLEDRQSVMDAAKTAAKNDIQLDVVGLGSTTPVPIPIKGGGYLIDPETGEVLPEGSQGELVFTSITKKAFPLLRYRTRDICVLTRKKCSCGRTHVKMSKPMGRSDDMLIVKGVNVFPSQIETVLLEQGYPANYQIIVDRINNSDTLEVMVEMSPENFSDNLGKITEIGERACLGA